MLIIDTHTHVNLSAFDDDRDAVIARSLDAGIGMINVGTQFDTSKKACDLARQYPEGVYAAVGLHPVHTSASYHDTQELGDYGKAFTSRGEVFDASVYRELAALPGVVAIGECGLDYFRTPDADAKARQIKAFEAQIELANELGKPLMLHLRSGKGGNAYQDALDILRAATVLANAHFFAGSWEDACDFFDLGHTISVTGVITFTHDYDEVIKHAPLDRLHAETDAPYVAPAPHRGKRNEPAYVPLVVARIAEIRDEPLPTVTAQLRENARRMYGI
jgi:TatD DNase family protein